MIKEEEEVQSIAVKFIIPFTPRVPDSVECHKNAYNVNINGNLAQLRFKKILTKHDDMAIPGRVEPDRLGKISRTEVQVWFGREFIETAPDFDSSSIVEKIDKMRGSHIGTIDEEAEYYMNKSVRYLNRFVEVYKSASHDYWMRPLNVEEVMNFDIRLFKNDEEFREVSLSYTPSEHRGFGSTLPDDLDEKMRTKLLNESNINPYQRMDLDALDKLTTQEFDLSVIASYRFFEIWLKAAVETVLDSKGWSQNEIDEFMKTDGEYDGFKNICHNHIPNRLGFDLTETNEFQKFREDAYELRHEIIHQGKNASKKEASDAYTACSEARSRFLEEFNSELEGTKLYSIPISDTE
jgi:hypothetical protein